MSSYKDVGFKTDLQGVGILDIGFKTSLRKTREIITAPLHWKQPYYSGLAGSPKFDKIIEMIREINNNGLDLDTILADIAGGVTPDAHKTSHEDGGGDEISVAGLSGILADPQPVKVERNSMPLYEHTRLATGWSWNSDDQFPQNSNKTITTHYIFCYPMVRESLTTIEVRVYGSFTGDSGEGYMNCYVYLERLDDGGTWTTVSTNSYIWTHGVTSTQTIILSSITPATAANRQFRIRISKYQYDSVSISLAIMRIYAINLTQ